MKKKNLGTGFVILVILVLIAIVIAGQTFSTIDITGSDYVKTEVVGSSCTAVVDCYSQIETLNPYFEESRVSCESGKCYYDVEQCFFSGGCAGGDGNE